MAKKAVKNNTVVKRADKLKKQVKNIHADVLEASDNFVEESIATGEKWQKIFAKALKGGTKLLARQQEFTLDVIEEISGQVKSGNFKMQNLLELKTIEEVIGDAKVDFKKATKKATKKARKEAKKVANSARKEAMKVADTAKRAVASIDLPNLPTLEVKNKTTKVTTKKAKAAGKKVTAKAKKVNKIAKKAVKASAAKTKAVKKAATPTTKTVKKVAKKVVKPAAKKATKKVVKATKKVSTNARMQKDDLTIINGVGPKVNLLLNKAGIKTYKQLSVTKIADLKTILDAAGSRYKLINPGTWKAEAKLASQGKFDLLKEFQKQNKK